MTASPDRTGPSTGPATNASQAPLRLPPASGGWRQTLWVLLGVAGLCGVLVACALYTAPAVLSDWQVREAAQPVPDARVSDGRCSTKLVVHICDATLSLSTPKGAVTRRVNYVFTGVHLGDDSISVMADPARPDLVTTDLGLDRLVNRTITLVVVLLATFATIVAALAALVRNRRAGA
ncbi:hypothetical protein AFCDBAGC_0264 [Methylobacterium cerastii]|uniref:DUF3592 domain-containing protein n=1 Tax=Methylobacterium cerastii TaxID=932741 RepID=A0ABQ4QB50_9HYPH|nr:MULTISPECIES: hypothetical protein [Methylobacterium]GJD42428.1 hypothetical protein AFCDBAGC_0264 [Methylobacterium cerastii]